MTVFTSFIIFLGVTACHAETDTCNSEGCASSADDDRFSTLQIGKPAPNLIEVVKPKKTRIDGVNDLDNMDPSTLAKVMDIAFPQTFAIMTSVLSTDYCWRTTMTRDEISPRCGPHQHKSGLRCRDNCPAGWEQKFTRCQEKCPSGSEPSPVQRQCKYKVHRKSGCRAGFYKQGLKKCIKDIQSYDNGKERKEDCYDAKYPVLMKNAMGINKCYEKAPDGFDCDRGFKKLCWANCPVGMVACPFGMACASSKGGCGAKIAEMTVGAATAVASTASLIGSFGAAGAGGTQALNAGKKTAIDKATRTALKNAAKDQLKGMQGKLLKEGIKKKILKDVKEKIKELIEGMLDSTATKLASDAVDAAIGEFEKKSAGEFTEDFFDSIDPTGIKAVVDVHMDKQSSGLDKAKAWMDVASLIDPTGWIAAAATFMNPKCAEV